MKTVKFSNQSFSKVTEFVGFADTMTGELYDEEEKDLLMAELLPEECFPIDDFHQEVFGKYRITVEFIPEDNNK